MNKKIRVYKEIGKVLINFGNLTFASLVLGGILKGDHRVVMLWGGGSIAVILIVTGIIFLTQGEKPWK